MNLLFFDIDGTLTDNNTGLVPQDTLTAIHKAMDNGNLCFINSGRPYSIIEEKFRGMMNGVVCGLGTYITCNGEDLLFAKLDQKICDEIVELALRLDVECSFEGRYKTYNKKEYRSAFFNGLNVNFESKNFVIADYMEEKPIFEKFCTCEDEFGDYKTFDEFVLKYFVKIDRGNNFYEYQRIEYSKATGIDFLCSYYNVPLENCYVFGDSNNDWSMLEHVKHSVLMGNGVDNLKDKVEFVTTDSAVDGISVALKHYNLI